MKELVLIEKDIGEYYKGGNVYVKEFYEKWTKEFMDSWKELDWKRTLKTLSEDVEYYENPINKPCANFEKVTNLWSVVADNQKDIDYKSEIVTFNEETCIINWQMNRTMTKGNINQEIDGIFQDFLKLHRKRVLTKPYSLILFKPFLVFCNSVKIAFNWSRRPWFISLNCLFCSILSIL